MPSLQRTLLATTIALPSGTGAVAGQLAPAPTKPSSTPEPAIALHFCDGEQNRDALFRSVEADQVCAFSVLRNLVGDERERVSLAFIASSCLAAVDDRRSTRPGLPLPVQLLGTMIVHSVQAVNERRRGLGPDQRPSLPTEPELDKEHEPVNWAARGLFRAQAAGSCEAVTVGLFKRLSTNDALGPGQRLMARRIRRAFGMAAFHPDDRCLRMAAAVDRPSGATTAR